MTRRIAILAGLLLIHPCSRATIYVVAPDGSGDFPTIQAAVDGSATGDTIELTSGVFRGEGNWDVYVARHLTICGKQEDASTCIIDCLDAAPHRAFSIDGWGVPVFKHITMRNGSAFAGGAAATGSSWSAATFISCVFENNAATWGGALCGNGLLTLTNCTFVGNASENGAHVCAFDWGEALSHNCIFAFSSFGTPFGQYDNIAGMTCCNVFGNAGGDYVGPIADRLGVEGNICSDPLFCDPGASDLSLREDSPCAPFSPPNPECDLIGALPVRCGPTDIRLGSWGAMKGLYR